MVAERSMLLSQVLDKERGADRALRLANRLAVMPPLHFYSFAALSMLVIGGSQYLSLHGDTARSSAISYLCLAFALQFCALCCLPYMRSTTGPLHVHWTLFFSSIEASVICYTLTGFQHLQLLSHGPAMLWIVLATTVSEALWLMAATMFFSGASRSMTLLDSTQALLFIGLRVGLTYAPLKWGHLGPNPLSVKLWMSLGLVVIAWIAAAGASTRGERRFLRMLAGFLVVRAGALFLANQVGYLHFHHRGASAWNVLVTLLFLGQAAYMARAWRRPVEAPLPEPRLIVRNLMPSLLALTNFALAFCAMSSSRLIGILATLLAMVCYTLRTSLLQEQNGRERETLLSRNIHLEALVERDALTGVGNRRSLASLYTRLNLIPGQTFALVLVDADHFKRANDNFGHLYGDQVLKGIASVMRRVGARFKESHCVRFGGDEFALCLPNVRPEEAVQAAELIRASVEALDTTDEAYPISASLGGVLAVAGERLPLEELLSRADGALYRAKQRGRNCVEWDCTPAVLKDRVVTSVRTEFADAKSGLYQPGYRGNSTKVSETLGPIRRG